jgi:UDP-2-acetamido-3-amino-2,3-dideoxy-glucuronate N-acetyltransferase
MNNTRIIHSSVKLGAGTTCGEFVVIEEGVIIGKNCAISHHVVIRKDTKIGDNVRIDEHTVVGKFPMIAALSAITKAKPIPPAEISDGVIIGSNVVVYAGCKIGSKVLIADLASVREDVTIGNETIIGRGATIENKCTIGARCKIQTNVYICAISSVGDNCFIAPCVVFTNDNFLARDKERFKYHKGVTLLKGARVGANAIILPGKTVHEEGLVAAGSIVTRDVPSRKTVLGVPARVIRDVPEAQLLENQ